MSSIYRYLAEEQHALDLMSKGIVFLNTLAFFRRCEDGARGDPHDAQLRYQPEGGLPLTNVTTGQPMQLPDGFQFVSSAKADQLFAYCSSQTKSEALAREGFPAKQALAKISVLQPGSRAMPFRLFLIVRECRKAGVAPAQSPS